MESHIRERSPARTVDSDREDCLRSHAVRQRIMAVAKHKFARVGYHGASLDDIRRSADLSWDEFRTHFEDKEPLLEAVLDNGWKALAERLAELVFSSPNARVGMLALLALMANMIHEDEDWVRLMLFEARNPDGESGEIRCSAGYRKFIHLCRELVIRGQGEGSFRKEYHPKVVASLLVGGIEGIMRDRLMEEQEDTITPYTGTYLMSAFDGLVSYLSSNSAEPKSDS